MNELAFPIVFPKRFRHPETDYEFNLGMTLRDHFAGQALIARMSGDIGLMGPEKIKTITESCYQIADAMLEARNAP